MEKVRFYSSEIRPRGRDVLWRGTSQVWTAELGNIVVAASYSPRDEAGHTYSIHIQAKPESWIRANGDPVSYIPRCDYLNGEEGYCTQVATDPRFDLHPKASKEYIDWALSEIARTTAVQLREQSKERS